MNRIFKSDNTLSFIFWFITLAKEIPSAYRMYLFLWNLLSVFSYLYSKSFSTSECLNPCDCPSNNQSMDIVSSFICVDSLQIDSMPKHMVLFSNTISSHHLSGISCNLDSFHAVVPLHHRNLLNWQLILLFKARNLKYPHQTKRNINLHVS